MSPLAWPLHLPIHGAASTWEQLLRANRLAEAEAACLVETVRRPRDARPLVASGHLALMRNDLVLASERLSAALARDRTCRESNELLAEVAYRRGDFEVAATYHAVAGNRPVAAKLRAFAGRRPYEIDGPQAAQVPFVRTAPLPILTARVNGGAEVNVLLDTGAAELILDESFARAGTVRVFGGQRSYFAGGTTARLDHAAVDSLALGDITLRNVPAQILDLGRIASTLGVDRLAGIVGTSVLYRFLATINYPAERLILRRRGAVAPASDAAIAVPMLMADDHFLLVEGRLDDGPPLMWFVDSGLAGGSFACPASTLREAGIKRGSTPIGTGRGGGGEVRAWPFEVSSLSVGRARREGLQGIAGVFPPKLEWAFGFRIGGLVSHGFLRAYAVTFDFDQMLLWLDPGLPQDPGFPSGGQVARRDAEPAGQ